MKKYLIIIFCLFQACLNSHSAIAQGGYFMVHVGYGLKMSAENVTYFDMRNLNTGSYSNTAEQINISLGKGLTYGGGWGYMFNKSCGIEIDISHLFGAQYKSLQEHPGIKDEGTLSAKMTKLNPSIVIASGFTKINGYAKIGYVLGKGSLTYGYTSLYNGNLTKLELVCDGGLAHGMTASLGAVFNAGDRMCYFTELNMVNLSYSPTKGKIISYNYNGQDRLSSFTTNQKEVEFLDNYTENVNSANQSYEPSKDLKTKYPFGSVGITIGLRLNLYKPAPVKS